MYQRKTWCYSDMINDYCCCTVLLYILPFPSTISHMVQSDMNRTSSINNTAQQKQLPLLSHSEPRNTPLSPFLAKAPPYTPFTLVLVNLITSISCVHHPTAVCSVGQSQETSKKRLVYEHAYKNDIPNRFDAQTSPPNETAACISSVEQRMSPPLHSNRSLDQWHCATFWTLKDARSSCKPAVFTDSERVFGWGFVRNAWRGGLIRCLTDMRCRERRFGLGGVFRSSHRHRTCRSFTRFHFLFLRHFWRWTHTVHWRMAKNKTC